MDNYREVELLAQKTVGDSGTETIDINVNEPITELSVKFGLTNDTAQADDVPPECAVSKIEIVDGGQVYVSINGRQATALAWYDKGRWPAHWYEETLSGGQDVEWPMQFGRFVGDEQFALSPSRLLNPQLKITWAKDDLHLTNVCTLEVNAKLMEGVSPPSHALLTKDIRSWTTAAAGIEEIDLPTDHPYRRLYFGLNAPASWFGATWSNFRLECGVGKLIVFDKGVYEMLNLMDLIWGKAEYTEYIIVDDSAYHQAHLGVCDHAVFTSMDSTIVALGSPTLPGYVRTYARYITAGTAANDVKVNALFRGLCPEYTYCYPFGRQDDPASWFQSSKYGSIKLKITEGVASKSASVLVQQPVPLP